MSQDGFDAEGPGDTFLAEVIFDAEASLGRPPLTDNIDPERFPTGMAAVTVEQTAARIAHLRAHAADWAWLVQRLDAADRARLAGVLGFHLVGPTHARVGPSRATVARLLAEADERLIVARDVTLVRYAGGPATHRFDLTPLGWDVVLESYTLGVQGTFQFQQYRCPDHPPARPAPGDIAVDAGGCFGETALWLAAAVGPTGVVHTLEFAPENLTILEANLAANPALGARVTLTQAAAWSASGARLGVARGGPASTLTTESSDTGPRTVAVDDLLVEPGDALGRVDFLKMDIEGAEPAALVGARRTLLRWTPKVALATYHDIDHVWQLAQALDGLDRGYRFALGHFTMHAEETVLYGWVP